MNGTLKFRYGHGQTGDVWAGRSVGIVDAELYTSYLQEPDDPEEPQTYSEFLWATIETQLDILNDSSRRFRHISGPILMLAALVRELERQKARK